ncbi:MAG: hypothetical protein QOG51_2132, partial [Verrucomicrobiota bacterium]
MRPVKADSNFRTSWHNNTAADDDR